MAGADVHLAHVEGIQVAYVKSSVKRKHAGVDGYDDYVDNGYVGDDGTCGDDGNDGDHGDGDEVAIGNGHDGWMAMVGITAVSRHAGHSQGSAHKNSQNVAIEIRSA